jgi:ABC-2 type transport system ATP-binding protein
MQAASSAIEIHDLWKTYGDVKALRALSLSVPPGSVYGFLGPNGAGKTTTIRLILGLQRPDRGTLLLFGRALRENRVALFGLAVSIIGCLEFSARDSE